MSRHANLKHLIAESEMGEDGYYDENANNDYYNYGDEDYGNEDYYVEEQK